MEQICTTVLALQGKHGNLMLNFEKFMKIYENLLKNVRLVANNNGSFHLFIMFLAFAHEPAIQRHTIQPQTPRRQHIITEEKTSSQLSYQIW